MVATRCYLVYIEGGHESTANEMNENGIRSYRKRRHYYYGKQRKFYALVFKFHKIKHRDLRCRMLWRCLGQIACCKVLAYLGTKSTGEISHSQLFAGLADLIHQLTQLKILKRTLSNV